MNDTGMTSHVNNSGLDRVSAREDRNIVDVDIDMSKSERQAMAAQLAASIAATTRPSVSSQLAASIAATTRPSVSSQLAASIAAMTRPSVSRQMAASIAAMTRPSVSSQLAASIAAMTRPSVSRQMAASIAAMTRPSVSRQMAASIAAMTRPSVSRQMAASIAAMTRPSVSRQMAASIAAMTQPSVSSQLIESLGALNLRLVTVPELWFKKPLDVHAVIALNVDPQLIPSTEERRSWSSSELVEGEDTTLAMERQNWLTQFDVIVTDSGLRVACRSLFSGGHYALAVQKACTYIDNMVRQKSGHTDKDGADLMRVVFSPNRPILRLNKLENRSDRNEQQGYMEIFAGTMIGIRNPRVHEYDLEDSPGEALEMLVMANHLIRMLSKATLV